MNVGTANPRWRRKRSRHSWRMRNPQFCVPGKRSMDSEYYNYGAGPFHLHFCIDIKSMLSYLSCGGLKAIRTWPCMPYREVGYLCLESYVLRLDQISIYCLLLCLSHSANKRRFYICDILHDAQKDLVPVSISRSCDPSIRNPIVEIISTLGFPIQVKQHLYIESGPCVKNAHYAQHFST